MFPILLAALLSAGLPGAARQAGSEATAPQTAVESPAESVQVAKGLLYRHLKRTNPQGEPLSIHILEVSRREKSLGLRTVRGEGEEGELRRELPTAMAQRAAEEGAEVLAVVNGDFNLGAPYAHLSDGLDIVAGALAATGKPNWPVFAILTSGEPLIAAPEVRMTLEAGARRWSIAALNKPLGSPHGEGMRVFTRQFGAAVRSESVFHAVRIESLEPPLPLRVNRSVRGIVREVLPETKQAAIPPNTFLVAQRPPAPAAEREIRPLTTLRPGDKVTFSISARIGGKKNVAYAIGGYPVLVVNGRARIVGPLNDYIRQRHPRTGACYTDKEIKFFVVDGRNPRLSVGMFLEELAALMVEEGCQTGYNTDGGGSSVMAIRHTASGAGVEGGAQSLRIVNYTSDGRERVRGNAFLILGKK
jgi:hypothetical protein